MIDWVQFLVGCVFMVIGLVLFGSPNNPAKTIKECYISIVGIIIFLIGLTLMLAATMPETFNPELHMCEESESVLDFDNRVVIDVYEDGESFDFCWYERWLREGLKDYHIVCANLKEECVSWRDKTEEEKHEGSKQFLISISEAALKFPREFRYSKNDSIKEVILEIEDSSGLKKNFTMNEKERYYSHDYITSIAGLHYFKVYVVEMQDWCLENPTDEEKCKCVDFDYCVVRTESKCVSYLSKEEELDGWKTKTKYCVRAVPRE